MPHQLVKGASKVNAFEAFFLGFPVFAFVLVVEDTQVADVAGGTDALGFHSSQDSAARLLHVQTVVETAVSGGCKNLREVMAYLFRFHVEGAETFDAWRVNQVATPFQRIHFREGGGVHAFEVAAGDVAHLDAVTGVDAVDQGGFAHP